MVAFLYISISASIQLLIVSSQFNNSLKSLNFSNDTTHIPRSQGGLRTDMKSKTKRTQEFKF